VLWVARARRQEEAPGARAKMNLYDLAKLVHEKSSTLFIGAGFSMDSGGPGGYRLITEL